MMGEVPPGLRKGLRRVLIAAASRDGKGMVDGIRDVGVLLPSADTAELERAMTTLFARFGGMGFAELQEVDPREFRAFAIEFGDVVRSLPFQLPENFLLIIRAMSLISGICSSLEPGIQHLGCRRALRRPAHPPRGRQRRAGVREAGGRRSPAPSRGCRSGSTT